MITRRELLALIPAARAMPAAQAPEVSFERIDVHLHIQRSAPVFVAAMEKAGWRGLSICDCRAVGDEVFDLEKDLQGTLTLHRESKGRIAWAATFDPRLFERPDFSSRVIANLVMVLTFVVICVAFPSAIAALLFFGRRVAPVGSESAPPDLPLASVI